MSSLLLLMRFIIAVQEAPEVRDALTLLNTLSYNTGLDYGFRVSPLARSFELCATVQRKRYHEDLLPISNVFYYIDYYMILKLL